MDVRPFLDDLAARIDPAVERGLWAQWQTFTAGRWPEPVFRPRRPRPAPARVTWPKVSVNQALDDPEAMLLQQLRSCSDALATCSGNLLCVRCNYGTPILPSLFGCETYRMEESLETLPAARPYKGGGLAAVRELLDRGMPDLEAGWGGQVFEMAARFQQALTSRPVLQEWVTLYHPDTQGPMDVCELLWGSDIFVDLYDVPDVVHAVLRLATDTYIAFLRRWQAQVPDRVDGTSVHWGWLQRGRIMLRNDSAMNLSAAMYDEFIAPYDARCLAELGGGAIHYCGRGHHWLPAAAALPGVHAINLSQPHLNDMQAVLKATVARGINLLALKPDAADMLVQAGADLRGRVHV